MRIILYILLFSGLADAWSGSNVCSRSRLKCRWVWGCLYSTWQGCCAWGNVIEEYYEKEYFCCSGWRHNGNQYCNIAICPYDCGGVDKGTCIRPDVCQCKPGYIGQYCLTVGTCSHLKPCYPGYCNGASNTCQCTNNFYPQTSVGKGDCLNFPSSPDAYNPSIEQSTIDFGYYSQTMNMLIFNMTIDSAMSDGNKEIFWTNREQLNIMNFTFQSISNFEILNLPTRPSYIVQHELGIVDADIIFSHTDINGREKDKKNLVCEGVSRDNPVYDKLFQCKTSIVPFDIRIDSGDTFAVTYRTKNGGYRILEISGDKQYFIGNEVNKMIEVKFDRDYPYHCTEKNDCTSSDMLKVTDDITKTAIHFTWNGWRDDLSKVARYALEVFKLEPDGTGALKEPYTDTVDNPVPLNITEFNETTSGLHTFSYRPNKPGVYSWILEVNDKANNSVYVRRIVIYDPVSSVTTDSSQRLYASSGNPNASFNWQTHNPLTAKVTWKKYFLNSLHENGKFLDRVRLFPDSLYDGGSRNGYKKILPKYDDFIGKRTINAIPNERGIVKYDVAYYNGKDQRVAPSYQLQNLMFNETERTINLSTALKDGRSLSVWVKAYDVLGNTNEERLVLHYDSSKPSVQSQTLQRNVGTDKMDYTSRVHVIGASDPHSGVKTINYRFIAKSTGKTINNKEYEYENPKRDSVYCNLIPCDTISATGELFSKIIDLDFENCYAMNVSDVFTEEVRMEMDFYNSAGLYVTRIIEITNLTSLKGVNDYFGPTDIRVAEKLSATSVKIMWNQAPSCYNQQGINFTYIKENTKEENAFPVHKDSDWFTMSNLDPGSTYILRLYTLYGDDEENPIRSEVSEFKFTNILEPEKQTSNVGAVAGGVVGGLLLIIIAVLLLIIIMVRRGKMNNPIERLQTLSTKSNKYIDNDLSNVEKRLNNTGVPKSYNNRAYSQEFDDDVYYAENETPLRYQIVRSRITFEEEIARGKFAIIYKAKYCKDNSSATVVAKTLKENPTQVDIETMYAKVNFYTLKIGEHPNVLKFIGVVDDDVLGRFMVLEYCENGPLKDYLKTNKHRVNDEMHEKLFRFACGICKGMNYLASQGVVHRRLAARNILLTFLLETKITGFGPEPRDNDGDSKNERIPVKWMAPECIKTTKYATEKSDVWSYGVLLWEIFSMGESPYEGIRSNELESKLKRGERLKKPEHSDDVFYKIMKKCWQYESGKRPNFEEIHDELQTLFTGNIDGDDYYYTQGGLYDNRKA